MKSLIEVNGVYFSYQKEEILTNINLSIFRDEIITIIGPNGAGKSTLLAILIGLIKPKKGAILKKENLKIGFVPQNIQRDKTLPITVNEFISLSSNTLNRLFIEENYLLKKLKVSSLLKKMLADLSGGELQKVLLTRAILKKPDILILDEPTAGIDVNGQNLFYENINQLKNKYGFSIILVSHDLHLVMRATDRVICLNKHICCTGTPDTVTQDPNYLSLFKGKENVAIYRHETSHHKKEHN